jgi:hypothetical protein
MSVLTKNLPGRFIDDTAKVDYRAVFVENGMKIVQLVNEANESIDRRRELPRRDSIDSILSEYVYVTKPGTSSSGDPASDSTVMTPELGPDNDLNIDSTTQDTRDTFANNEAIDARVPDTTNNNTFTEATLHLALTATMSLLVYAGYHWI